MSFFGGLLAIKDVTFLVFCVFVIIAAGYILGKISIDDISLGTAGVFIVALLFGALFYSPLMEQLKVAQEPYVAKALKIIENIGLILFVTSVGFLAGPGFFEDLRTNFKSYVLLGLIIILLGGISCAACIIFDYKCFPMMNADGSADGNALKKVTAMLVGLLSGSLTSTPAFSASKETIKSMNELMPDFATELENIVAVGHGIAYLFGVVGVVLFVQIVPKMLGANMDKERKKLIIGQGEAHPNLEGDEIELDPFGFCAFSIVAFLGILVGSFKVAGFSLTTTGGCLILALIAGHFARIGNVAIMPHEATLKVFREVGLVFFLIGAGVAGGASFVRYFKPVYFIYGVIMTMFPLVVGFFFAKYVLKMNLLNNLGSICGGMTSTPALGTLIHTAGTEKVAGAYASTYPMALIAVVVISQLLIKVFQ